MLAHEPYRGATLTADGRRIALRMLRRHRLIESYLVAHLGYTWDTVHDEAERLEHAVSDTLVERMAKVLGDPLEDPHGDPIPGPDGSLAEIVYVALAEVAVGAEVAFGGSFQPATFRTLTFSVDTTTGAISGISFAVSKASKLLDDARSEAIADARRKAEIYAKAANISLCAPVSISEETTPGPVPYRKMAAGMAASAPVAQGEETLRVSVSVSYELKQKAQ